MGTRYVYGLYNVVPTVLSNDMVKNFDAQIPSGGSYSVVACSKSPDSYVFDAGSGDIKWLPNGETYAVSSGTADASAYKYIVCNTFENGGALYRSIVLTSLESSGAYWKVSKSGSYVNVILNSRQDSAGTALEFVAERYKPRDGSTLLQYKTANTYHEAVGLYSYVPETADAKWESYLGSDRIDAASVSYSLDKPERNKPVTIKVTPGSGKKYSGTVYYQYEYSIGNGWILLGDKTTATEKTMSIPADAKTFQARVLASDDLGFTSTTYTTGAKLAVQSIQAHVGVSGTARRVSKMYIGVNGAAREVTAGYVGDANGKARKWF